MRVFTADRDYTAQENTVLEPMRVSELLASVNESSLDAKNAFINIGGWQSWNPGLELAPGRRQPSLRCHLISQWNCYLVFPSSRFRPTKNRILAQFVAYFRWDDTYLFLVSCGNISRTMPPVQFIIDRKKNTVRVELCDKGHSWKKDEVQAEIEIFAAKSYFEAREKLKGLFPDSRFKDIAFLGDRSEGWESWYNHYADINEGLIMADLEALPPRQNFVFQIDDGWEQQLGTWELNTSRFPSGFKSITQKIEKKGFVPGLWIAPFIVDYRSTLAREHPDWLLRRGSKLVPAGFNPLWGDNFGRNQPSKPGTFFCLDLSNKDCVDYLDFLIDRAINEWGFRYLKLDFLYAGMLDGDRLGADAAYVHFARAIARLTARKTTRDGRPVAYLGCGTPLEMSFKALPLSRIGCDTYEHWENEVPKALNWNGRNSAYLNLTDSIGRAIWNKTIFANDPDVIFIREENCSLSKNNKLLIAFVAAAFGSQLMHSDDPARQKTESEQETEREIAELFKTYGGVEFSVKAVRDNVYSVESKDKKYKGILNLEEGYADIR